MAVLSKTRTNSGISTYLGPWDKSAVIHLLRRVHFGVTKENIDYFSSLTQEEAITEVLNIDYNPPSPPINNYNNNNPDANVNPGETWVNDYNSSLNSIRRRSFKSWWVGQIVNHDRTIREKMVLFWHNHFSTQSAVYGWANYGYQNNQLLRSNCLKNFKSLVKDITLDPAMLIYLNGERNSKSAPDENYSRELQELFTLGKGSESKYTESDVIAGAKVLTGWRISRTTGIVYFESSKHDTSDKVFSSYYNNHTVSGKTGQEGTTELDDMLNMIFTQNEVANHIIRKLYRWFVYYKIDENIERNVITPLANIFRNSGYEIKPVLEALFSSEHFFDTANRGAIIKSPADLTIGITRTFDIPMPGADDYVDQYTAWNRLLSITALTRQDIGDPPSVSGWPAYYQIPQFHELWINSDTISNRNKISDALAANGYSAGSTRLKIDPLHFAKKLDNASDPNLLINELIEMMHTLDVDQNQREFMKSILLSGQVNDDYWTQAWNEYLNDQNNTTKANIVSSRLSSLYKYLMNLSEFQLS
jgi:uncharacterized protein (DUF1800 family)